MRFPTEAIDDLVDDFVADASHDPPPTETEIHTTVGDAIRPRPEGHIRLATINVNGIRSRNTSRTKGGRPIQIHTEMICHSAKNLDISMIGITEPNLDFMQREIRNEIERGIKKIDKVASYRTATSVIPADNTYKPGGILSICFNDICGKIKSSEYDITGLGRWTITKIQGAVKRNLVVVTVYIPIEHTNNTVTSVAAQQSAILKTAGFEGSPSLQAWTDLRNLANTLTDEGHDLIIMGDLNASFASTGTNDELLKELCTSTGLTDAVTALHPEAHSTPTVRNGRRLDYILCSPRIAPCVKRAGILPLGDPFITDHRPIYCDIDMRELYGTPTHSIVRPDGRTLQHRNIQQVGRFHELLDRYMRTRQVHKQCMDALFEISKYGPTAKASAKARKADEDLRWALITAERKCGSRYIAPWSKKLHAAAKRYNFWSYARLRYAQPMPPEVLQRAAKENITFSPSIALEVIIEERRMSEKKLIEIRSNAHEERTSMIDDEIHEAVLAGDKNRARTLRRINDCEATRESYAKLKSIKDRRSAGLTAVQIEQPDGSIKTTSDPTEMEELLVQEGRRHYAQAHGTPFTVGPLADIQYTADCLRADAVLQGISPFTNDPAIPSFQQRWLAHAKKINLDPNSDMCVTLGMDDVRQGFAGWRTSTSTSPIGDHLGIYAALAKDLQPHIDDLPDSIRKSWPTIQHNAWQCVTAIMNMGASFGLTLPRWRTAVCVLIEKSPGNFLLNKLRRIFILPSDLNLTLGILVGRRLVYRAETLDTLHKDMWGTRPGRSAIDAVCVKELLYSLARLTNTPLATFDNDAKSCYDRIVMTVALLIGRRQGLPSKTAAWIAKLNKELNKFIQTGYGLSDSFWGNDDGSNAYQYGSLQGKTDSGAWWLLLACFLAERMDADAKGAYYCSPDGEIEFILKVLGFVDDVTGFMNRFREYVEGKSTSVSDITTGMQTDAQLWRDNINMTGGELEFNKCFWYLFFPTTDKTNRPSPMTRENLVAEGATITLTGPTGNTVINIKDPNEPHRTLGAHKTFMGDMEEQLKVSRDKSEKLAQLIWSANLSVKEAILAHEMIVVPSLSYPLATSYLKRDQLQKIHSPALIAVLGKMKLPRTIGRHQVFGQRDLGGLQLSSLIGMQTWCQFEVIQALIRRNDESSDLTRIALSWTQLVAGTGFRFLEQTTPHLSYMPRTILSALRDGLREHNASMLIHDHPFYPILRQNDQHIMDCAREFTTSRATLLDINLCRMFLGAITISDIATPDGRRIDKQAYLCKDRNYRFSRLTWPDIADPSPSQQLTWRRFIARTLTLSELPLKETKQKVEFARSDKADMQLKKALGRWTAPPLTRQIFPTLVSSRGRWKWNGTKYENGALLVSPDLIPMDAVPFATYDGRSRNTHGLPSINKTPYFPAAHRYIPTHSKSTTAHTPTQWSIPRSDIFDITSTLEALYFASDGGTDLEHGGFGAALSTPKGKIIATCSGPTTGFQHSSFREEAFAMLQAAQLFSEIVENGFTGEALFITDSKSLLRILKRTFKADFPKLKRNQNDYDLLWPLILTLWPYRDIFYMHWVKSHQDNKTPIEDLTICAKINIVADSLATSGLRTRRYIPVVPTKTVPTQLMINGKPITKYQRKSILAETYRSERTSALSKSENIPIDSSRQWANLGKSLFALPTAMRITISRFISNNLAIGQQLLYASKTESPYCESCASDTFETSDHMFCCPGHASWRQTTISKWNDFAKSNKWPDHARKTISKRMMKPREAPDPEDLWPDTPGILIWKGMIPTDMPCHPATTIPKKKGASQAFANFWFERFYALWRKRCDERHGSTDEERDAILKRKLRHRAKALTNAPIDIPIDSTMPTEEEIQKMGRVRLRAFIRWADVLLSHTEKPPPEPDPDIWQNYNFFRPNHSRTTPLLASDNDLETED